MVYSRYTWVDGTTVVNATRMNALEGAAAHADVKIVHTTHDISIIGDQAITGVGFLPSGAIVLANIVGTAEASIGMTDGVTYPCISNQHNVAADTWGRANLQLVALWTGVGAEGIAVWKSFDADGMTITWSKIGSPTGTADIYIMFFR